jgi:hypothetical protein
MTNYSKPENLNGTELMAELSAVGIVVNRVRDNGDNTITLETDDDKAAAIVAAHNGTIVAPEPTIEDKLASVGLSLPDLKAALGL